MNNAKGKIQVVGVPEVCQTVADAEQERANQDKAFPGAGCRPSLSKMSRKRQEVSKRPIHKETRKGWGFQSFRKSKGTHL